MNKRSPSTQTNCVSAGNVAESLDPGSLQGTALLHDQQDSAGFAPSTFTRCQHLPYRYSLTGPTLTLSLPYRIAGPASGSVEPLEFCERFEFTVPEFTVTPEIRERLHNLFKYLHLAAGISYWKAIYPARLEIPYQLSVTEREFFETLFFHGLGEFCAVNELPLLTELPFTPFEYNVDLIDSCETDHHLAGIKSNTCAQDAGSRCSKPLLAFGGGKDSLVSYELLRQAGFNPTIGWVGSHTHIRSLAGSIQSEHGTEVTEIGRALDPLLFELNRKGAYNGHVPITGILAFALCAAALLGNHSSVVLSNERSADEPTTVYRGTPVNHQYSKSAAFEKDLCHLLEQEVPGAPRYFSLLRPYSELQICEQFARLPEYHHHFSSCNRSFKIHKQAQKQRWCGTCPKCAFVYVALLPFLNIDIMKQIFGGDLLESSEIMEWCEQMAGITGHKPYECVGECAEVRYAVRLAASQLASHGPLQRLASACARQFPEETLFSLSQQYQRVDPSPLIPTGFPRFPIERTHLAKAANHGDICI